MILLLEVFDVVKNKLDISKLDAINIAVSESIINLAIK